MAIVIFETPNIIVEVSEGDTPTKEWKPGWLGFK